MRALLVAALLCALLCGCEADVVPYTQVIVTLEADGAVREAVPQRLVLRVQNGRYGRVVFADTIVDPLFPIEVPVAPAEGAASTGFTLVAELYGMPIGADNTRRIGVQRAIVEYVPNELRFVTLSFVRSCGGLQSGVLQVCDPYETCITNTTDPCTPACIEAAPEGIPQRHVSCDVPDPATCDHTAAGTAPGAELWCERGCYCREGDSNNCYASEQAIACCDTVPSCNDEGGVGAGCMFRPPLPGDRPRCETGLCFCETSTSVTCLPPGQLEACCQGTGSCSEL